MQKLTISAKDLQKVITNMYPNLICGTDYSAVKYSDSQDILLEWNTNQFPEPLMSEIEMALPKILEEKAAKEAAKEIAKEIAQAKLAALGFTTDDLKALGLGTN